MNEWIGGWRIINFCKLNEWLKRNFYACLNYVNRKFAPERGKFHTFFFFFFVAVILTYNKMYFGKTKYDKNWTGSNCVCGFVSEIGAYHISYSCI